MFRIYVVYFLIGTVFAFSWCPKGTNYPSVRQLEKYRNNHKYDHIFQTFGTRYGFDPMLLKAMAIHESYLNHKTPPNGNENGTRDAGLMRINSSNTALLRKYNLSFNQVENPVVSVFLACEIFRDKVVKFGGGRVNLRSISAYNGSQNCSNRAYYYGKTVMYIYNWLRNNNAQLMATNEAEFPINNYAPLPSGNNHFAMDIMDSINSYLTGDRENEKAVTVLNDIYPWKIRMR